MHKRLEALGLKLVLSCMSGLVRAGVQASFPCTTFNRFSKRCGMRIRKGCLTFDALDMLILDVLVPGRQGKGVGMVSVALASVVRGGQSWTPAGVSSMAVRYAFPPSSLSGTWMGPLG